MKRIELEKSINGKAVADNILTEIASTVGSFSRQFRRPQLTVMLAGEDPASAVYVGMKVKAAGKCGIDSRLIELPAQVSEREILDRLEALNEDGGVDGILVQLPLPSHIDQHKVIERVSPDKDVDGFHPRNLGLLAADRPRFVPCTPLGISTLLTRYEIPTSGRNVVIIGRSIVVGKPLALLLSTKGERGNATVTLCHSRTADLPSITRRADILVAAIGKARMITGDMVKENVVVIDVGTNRVDAPGTKRGYRLSGDVDFDSVYPKASLITPVPGGVGPMTVAMLMQNTLRAAQWAKGVGNDSQ
ncbi:MAG: bifunctional 5,10-methylenetetrahydrofolate dehydrogenase/5,10-methenyltetrahydrofolate cyclohydrolase [Candidatus Krumholzibacteriota bacterium]|nr:bifunctional 5,10-methylenetetrahydrofolate dehydrogenase/5,10-methenyltetrahydrofolate cyclohydrolase [Candidatus Krumholzibacteriota bacterium]